MRLLWAVPLLLLTLICGCPKPAARTSPTPPTTAPSQQATTKDLPAERPPDTSTQAQLAFKVIDPSGGVVVEVGPDLTVNGKSGQIGKLKLDGSTVKIDDASGTKIGSVKMEGQELTLDDAQGRKIARMAPKDGGYRIKDAESNTLLKIKPDDDGFKLGDDAGKKLGKGKRKGGDTVISDADGDEMFRVEGPIRPNAAGVLIVEQLTPIQQAALIYGASK